MPDQNDKFTQFPADYHGSATPAFAITSSETANTTHTTRAVYVGETGDLTVEMSDAASGTTTLFKGVPAGAVLPIRVRKVRTATTANSVVGLY